MISTAGERMAGIIMLATITATGAVLAPLTHTHWLDAILLPCITLAALAALAGLFVLVIRAMQRIDPIWAAGGAIAVDDHNTLIFSSKRLLRPATPDATVNLDLVQAATWDISPFSRTGTLHIQLWDHDPQLTFGLFGIIPNSGGEPLMDIPTNVLTASPTAAARLQHYLEVRIEAGTLDCNFTPHDFEPIPELRPPLEPGITLSDEGREIRRQPR